MTQTQPAHTGTPSMRVLRRSIVLSIVLPLVAIQVLLHLGVAPVTALAIAALFPLIEIGLEIVATRHVGLISGLALAGMAVGFGLTAVTGNGVFAVLKDSAITLVFGLIFLATLFTGKPMIYRFNIQMAGTDPAARAYAASLWEKPPVRRSFRFMTLVWGLGLVLEAAARVASALLLPLSTATALSPVIPVVAFGGLALWTVTYVRKMRKRIPRATEIPAA